jgi:ABC-type glycerol-3-phosphate transport system substrate-binding protein
MTAKANKINAKDTVIETIIDTNKTAYNYSFEILNSVQEQGEKALNAVLDKATWINGENRKAVDNWIGYVKDGQNNVKTVLDENLKTFERLLGGL